MKNVKQLRDRLEALSEEVGNTDVTKLTPLVSSGLLDKSKVALLERAIAPDSLMSKAERNTLLEVFDKLLIEVSKEKIEESRQETDYLDIELNEEPKIAIDINQIPPLLILKRRAIRVFPDGQKVALYWADRINKYISVPFESIGISEETLSEISQDAAIQAYLDRKQKEGSSDNSVDAARNRLKAHMALSRIKTKHGQMAHDIAKEAGSDAVRQGEVNLDRNVSNKPLGKDGYIAGAFKSMPIHGAIATVVGGLAGQGIGLALRGAGRFIKRNTQIRLPEEHMDATENFRAKLKELREQAALAYTNPNPRPIVARPAPANDNPRIRLAVDNTRTFPSQTPPAPETPRTVNPPAISTLARVAAAIGRVASPIGAVAAVMTPTPAGGADEDRIMADINHRWAQSQNAIVPNPSAPLVRPAPAPDVTPPAAPARAPATPAPSVSPQPLATPSPAPGAPAVSPTVDATPGQSLSTAVGPATAAAAAGSPRAPRSGGPKAPRARRVRNTSTGSTNLNPSDNSIKYPVKGAMELPQTNGIEPFSAYRNYVMSKTAYPGQVSDVNEEVVQGDGGTSLFIDPKIRERVKKKVGLPRNRQLASSDALRRPRLAQNVRQATVAYVGQALHPQPQNQQESALIAQLRTIAENSITGNIYEMRISPRLASEVIKSYDALNEENRLVFEQTINKDKDSFKKIINFALGN